MSDACKECNEPTSRHYPKSQEKGLCFLCDFWLEKVALADDPASVRIDGKHYFINPENPAIPKILRGYGGSKYVVHFKDGRIVTTTNFWWQGVIPDRFRTRLPDNATFPTP